MKTNYDDDFCFAGYDKCLFDPGSNCCKHCGRVRSALNIVNTAEWKSYSLEEDFERSRVETGVSNDVFNEDEIPMRDPYGRKVRKSPAQRREEAFEAAVVAADLAGVEGVAQALRGCAVPFEKGVHKHLTEVCEKCELLPPLPNKVWVFFHNFVGAWCRSSAPLVQARIAAEYTSATGRNEGGKGNNNNSEEEDEDEEESAVTRRARKNVDRQRAEIGKRVIVGFIKRNFPGGDKYICGCIHVVCRREQQGRTPGHLSFRAISVKSGCASVKEIYSALKVINKVVPPHGAGEPAVACANYDGIIENFANELRLEFPAKRMSKNVGRMLKELMAGPFAPDTVGATAIYLVCSRIFQEKYPLALKDYAAATGLSEKTLKRAFSKADSDPRMFSLPFKEANFSGL